MDALAGALHQQECAVWDLAHIKAVRVSNSSCTPYQSMRRDSRIYSYAAGAVAHLRKFCIAELGTVSVEACPRYGQQSAKCITINVFLNFMRDAGNRAGRGCVVGLA